MSLTSEAGRRAVEAELSHHGVKGMHWGVRKERARTGAGAVKRVAKDVGFELHTDSPNNRRKIAIEATGRFEKDLPTLKAKHGASAELRTRIKSPLSKESQAYRKDARDTYLNHLENVANEHVNASGDRQRTLSTTRLAVRRVEVKNKKRFRIAEVTDPNTSKYLWHVRTRDIQHADQLFCKVEPIFDSEGFITTAQHVPDSLTQSALVDEFLLEHFGVKGMHWGVRQAREVSTKTHVDTGIVKRKTKITATGGEAHPAHPDAVTASTHQQKLKKSGTAALSNKELRDLITRRQLEDQVAIATTKKGRKFAKKQLEISGQQQVQRSLGGAAQRARQRAAFALAL